MKIFIVRPQLRKLFNAGQLASLRAHGELILIDTIQPVSEIPGLFEGNDERILALDPDSCDWVVPNEVVDKTPNLKAIILQTTSFNWLDTKHAHERGIPVLNNPGFSTISVVEWATMAVLMLARKLPLVIKNNWQFDFETHRGFELRGKRAGIIGLGRIGKATAKNLQGLGMNIQYWSKHTRDNRFTYAELPQLFSESDVIVTALVRNEETAALLTDDLLRAMKPTSIFVTTGFSPNHQFLLDLVKNKKLFGYAFDEDHPNFVQFEGNIFSSPPLGWLTNESIERNAEQWTKIIADAAQGKFINQVN